MKSRDFIIRNWRGAFKSYGPYNAEARTPWLEGALKYANPHDHQMMEIIEEMADSLEMVYEGIAKLGRDQDPIAYFHPSWEQAQIINAWSPAYESHLAPKGYRSVCSFCANRIGKTCSCVIDTLLWLIPQNPDWKMFETFEDHLGRGKYTIFPRPDWERWHRKGKMTYLWEEAPAKGACDIWHGVGRDEDWTAKVYLEYRKWLPIRHIGQREDMGLAIFKKEKKIETAYGHGIIGMSINAEVEAWAGKAAWRVNIDEGITRDIMNEALVRVMDGGYVHWAYTPADAANIGQKARVAWEHWAKPDKWPLVGQAKFFLNFRMADAPEWIIPEGKRQDDLRRFAALGDEGRVRSEGGFRLSSPIVFSNFDRKRNVLPFDTLEFIDWSKIKDAVTFPLMIRGMDEGMANPTACVWCLITKNNEYVIVQEWQQAGLSVGQRCEKIVTLSRNEREMTKWDEDETRRRYKEKQTGWKIRRTFADSKMFKRNQENPQDDWTETYRRNGLSLERGSTIGTAARCDTINDMLRADPTREHILRKHDDPKINSTETALGPGARLYILRSCPVLITRLEEMLWEQLSSGPNKGAFTDKPEDRDDHLTDSLGYVCASKMRWYDHTQFEHSQQSHVSQRPASKVTGY